MSDRVSDLLRAGAQATTQVYVTRGDAALCALLADALQYAAGIAEEAEHDADRAATQAMTGVRPAYPPLVTRLAAVAGRLLAVAEPANACRTSHFS